MENKQNQILYRQRLAPFKDKRNEFTGTVKAIGNGVQSGIIRTLLIEDIQHDGKIVSKHAWIHSTVCDLSDYTPGDTITFSAVVTTYVSGYRKFKAGKIPRPQLGYCFAGVIARGRLSNE